MRHDAQRNKFFFLRSASYLTKALTLNISLLTVLRCHGNIQSGDWNIVACFFRSLCSYSVSDWLKRFLPAGNGKQLMTNFAVATKQYLLSCWGAYYRVLAKGHSSKFCEVRSEIIETWRKMLVSTTLGPVSTEASR